MVGDPPTDENEEAYGVSMCLKSRTEIKMLYSIADINGVLVHIENDF